MSAPSRGKLGKPGNLRRPMLLRSSMGLFFPLSFQVGQFSMRISGSILNAQSHCQST